MSRNLRSSFYGTPTSSGSYTVPDATIFNYVMCGELDRLRTHKNSLNTCRDYLGNNLLHTAVLCKNPQVIEYLLDAGISPHTKNKHGETPWDYVLKSQNKTIIGLFADTENPFREKNEKLITEVDSLKRQKTILAEDLGLSKQSVIILKRNCEKLKMENTESKRSLKRKRDEYGDLEEGNRELKKRNVELEDSNARLRNSISNLIKANRK